jgi:hypothetical protein
MLAPITTTIEVFALLKLSPFRTLTLGPTPNLSPPGSRYPAIQERDTFSSSYSTPPMRTTHSMRAWFPVSVETVWVSNCEPNWLMITSLPMERRAWLPHL